MDEFLRILRESDKPVLSKVLEERLSISGESIRKMVRDLRRAGTPVAASKSGYFIAQTWSEYEPTVQDLENRALSLLHTAKVMKSSFVKQQTLF